MPRTHQRKTTRRRFWVLTWKDLPRWARAVPVPRGVEPLQTLDAARRFPATLLHKPFSTYFARLEQAARAEFDRGNGSALLELLDIAPALLHTPADWILKGLFRFFQDRAYHAIDPLKARIGKVGSDVDLARKAVVEWLMQRFVDESETAQPPGTALRVGHFEPSGLTKDKAIQQVAQSEGVSVDAVEKSLKRANRELGHTRRPRAR